MWRSSACKLTRRSAEELPLASQCLHSGIHAVTVLGWSGVDCVFVRWLMSVIFLDWHDMDGS